MGKGKINSRYKRGFCRLAFPGFLQATELLYLNKNITFLSFGFLAQKYKLKQSSLMPLGVARLKLPASGLGMKILSPRPVSPRVCQ